MLVKVAIDLALDRLFTYEVPEALRKKLATGQLLSVPFGHREARGFAVAVEEACEASLKLKPVTAIVDEVPFFSAVLLELVKRVAAYTASPLESVLKAALPASVIKKNAHAKLQLFVDPRIDDKPGAKPVAVKLNSRQKWLFEQVRRLDGGWMRQLCGELKTTPSSLRHLAEMGLVKIEERARRRDPLSGRRILPTKPLVLNEEQREALKLIVDGASPVLLHGVTGSGKTEVYLQAIARELERDRGAIVMVPEISLTPQTVQRFASRFGDRVAVLHSALSDGERYDEWHRIRSGEARVVVGPRSAVWAPVRNLGLIVVDEEHDSSYKQDENPRYHARDVAVLRGMLEGARVVLGSATPSLETWLNAKRGKYALATIAKRAGVGQLPLVHCINLAEDRATPGAIFSSDLLEAIRRRLDRHEQTILFLNRRGYSRSMSCPNCGEVMTCPDCGVAYTYHASDKCLRCHICGTWREMPPVCPKCRHGTFDLKGIGTERAEAALLKCFPRSRVIRMDADSTSRRHSHDELLGAFRRQEADILLGTQMIAKGLDFPNVTLVGVLNADASLNLPDFRASERTYQLLSQVAGRAGRAELPGEVFIQSYDPSAFAIAAAARGDFAAFAECELKDREAAWLPPYCHLAVATFKSSDLRLAGDWAGMYGESLRRCAQRFEADSRHRFSCSEASPAALEKAGGKYRWQLVIRSDSVGLIVRAWRWIKSERPPPRALSIVLDIDAINVL